KFFPILRVWHRSTLLYIALELAHRKRRQPRVDFARQPHRLAADGARTREFARAHPCPDRGVGDVRDFADLGFVEQAIAVLTGLCHVSLPPWRYQWLHATVAGPTHAPATDLRYDLSAARSVVFDDAFMPFNGYQTQ